MFSTSVDCNHILDVIYNYLLGCSSSPTVKYNYREAIVGHEPNPSSTHEAPTVDVMANFSANYELQYNC
jgi:hypothetical protein